jgi:two-component system, NarL family, sensor histidine kinase NreB
MTTQNNLLSRKDWPYCSAGLTRPFDNSIMEIFTRINQLNISLLENSPFAIAIIFPDTAIKFVNSALEKITGFSRHELIELKAPYSFWPKEKAEQYTHLLDQMIAEEKRHSEMQLYTNTGEYFWVEATINPVSEESLKYYLINFIDITELRRMREETEFYLREVIRIQEEERKRIARELHDDTAQALAYISLELDSIIHGPEVSAVKINPRLANLKQQVENSLEEVRRFSHELRPGVIRD